MVENEKEDIFEIGRFIKALKESKITTEEFIEQARKRQKFNPEKLHLTSK